jgi:hypothetical protein
LNFNLIIKTVTVWDTLQFLGPTQQNCIIRKLSRINLQKSLPICGTSGKMSPYG